MQRFHQIIPTLPHGAKWPLKKTPYLRQAYPTLIATSLYEEARDSGLNVPPERDYDKHGYFHTSPYYTEYINQLAEQIVPLLNYVPPRIYSYFLTVTIDPSKNITHQQFETHIRHIGERVAFHTCIYAFEHKKSNYHAHMKFTTPNPQSKHQFNSTVNNIGGIKLINVKYDNGILKYITKEATHYYEKTNLDNNITWLTHENPIPESPDQSVDPPNLQ